MRTRNLLIAIVGVGALARFATLGSQGYWFDEVFTVTIASGDLGDVLDRIEATESTPPLYYFLAAVWERIFGADEVALRSLSALAGTATIPVVHAAGAALGSRRAGLAAAALTAASPLMIWYSQEARAYALLVLLAAVSFLFFARALDDRAPRELAWWALFSALALCTHYYAVALIAAEAAVLVWRRRDAIAGPLIATAALAAAGLALLPLALGQADIAGFIAIFDLGERLAQVPQHFVAGMAEPLSGLAIVLTLAVAALAVAGAIRARGEKREAAVTAGLVLAAGLGLVLVLALAGADYLLSRNLLALWPPFVVGLGALLAAPALDRAAIAAVGALCTAGLALAIWTAATPTAGRPDLQPLVAALGEPRGERAVFADGKYVLVPLETELPGSRLPPQGDPVIAQEVDLVGLRAADDDSVGPCWWVAFCGGRDLVGEPYELAVPPGFQLFDESATDQFEVRRYAAPEPVEIRPAGIDGPLVQDR